MKFQKLLMTGCRDMDIKIPPKMCFSPICDPQDFFQKSGSVTFVPLWYPNFMQRIRKNNERSLRYSKTDHRRTTDGPQTDHERTRAITKNPFG